MKNTTVALVVVIGILGGFYAGWKYSQSRITATPAAATSGPSAAATGGAGGAGGAGANGAGGLGGGGFAGGNAVSGPITAIGNGFITVHDRTTDKDVKVAYSPTVRIVKQDAGGVADLTQNTTVTVIGQADASGTVDATAITIGSAGGGVFGGGGGRRPSPTPSS